MIKQSILQHKVGFKETKRNLKIQRNKDFEIARTEAQIIKLVHAVEKGLSLKAPRTCFAIKKISTLFELAGAYISMGAKDNFCLYMVCDVIAAYLDFHKEINVANQDLDEIQNKCNQLKEKISYENGNYGGFSILNKNDFDFSAETVENLFTTRHSIRDFSGEAVDEKDLEKAIRLAQSCPSACNRQCSRVYSIKTEKFLKDLGTDLDGIGGFANEADGFVLVTGKQSAYGINERNQYIVSASIFAGYLSLALHAYGIASCVVQQMLLNTKQWQDFKKINSIPDDEQIVVMFAIGKYKEQTKVPISKRFPLTKIFRTLD